MPVFQLRPWPLRAASLLFVLVATLPQSLLAQDTSRPVLDPAASMTVNADVVKQANFTRYVSLSGTINAWQEVLVAAEVGGYRVEEVLVDVGDYVQAGQPLVRLSTALLQSSLAVSAATLKQREAEALNARLAKERGTSLADKSLLSAADLDRLNSESVAAEGRVEAARADLESAKLRLAYARVVAPDAGVISSRTINVGQIAQAGTEMLRLLRQNRVEWRGEVPESMLPELTAGQSVTVTSVDGREHQGTIRVVAPTVNATTHTGLIYVDVEADPALRPGMFARGKVALGQSQAILVPLSALTSSDGYNYVFVMQADNTVSRQLIQTGAIEGEAIEVLSGLQPGARIVTNGAGFLKDGDLVNLVEAR